MQSNKLLVGPHSIIIVINIERIYVKLITRWTATGKVEKNEHLPSYLHIKCITPLKMTQIVLYRRGTLKY